MCAKRFVLPSLLENTDKMRHADIPMWNIQDQQHSKGRNLWKRVFLAWGVIFHLKKNLSKFFFELTTKKELPNTTILTHPCQPTTGSHVRLCSTLLRAEAKFFKGRKQDQFVSESLVPGNSQTPRRCSDVFVKMNKCEGSGGKCDFFLTK